MDDQRNGRDAWTAPGHAERAADPDVPPPSDPLLAVRAELEDVDELPLAARAEVFERAHGVVVEELRALELG